VYAIAGLGLSIVAVRDTTGFLRHGTSSSTTPAAISSHAVDPESAKRVMFGVCQAGLVNNLNDGVSWGVLPLLFAAHGLAVDDIGIIKAVYPLTWSLGQLGTGALADRAGRRPLIIWGMIVQALALGVIGLGVPSSYASGVAGAVFLGLGTAMGALRDELSYFATCVARGIAPDRVTADDGIEAVRLALAAADSGAAGGQRIRIERR